MPSIVELIFSAIGTEAAAAAVGKVSDELGEMTRQIGMAATAFIGVSTGIKGIWPLFWPQAPAW